MQINGNTVDFFVIGDQGGIPDPPYYTHMLKKVADLMKNVAAAENTHFQFALGDNFYFDGVTSVDDPRFNVETCLFHINVILFIINIVVIINIYTFVILYYS